MIGVNNDHTPNSNGDNGEVAPSIGPSFGYANMGVNGEQAQEFVASHTNRAAVLQYCTHVVVEYGTNDLYLGGRTVPQLEGDLTTIYGYAAAGSVVFQDTLLPRTNSTDSWSTIAGQTYVNAGDEVERQTFNNAIRAATFGPGGGYFDPDLVVESAFNSGYWNASPTNAYCGGNNLTVDGVHPNNCGYYTELQGHFIDLNRIYQPAVITNNSGIALTTDGITRLVTR